MLNIFLQFKKNDFSIKPRATPFTPTTSSITSCSFSLPHAHNTLRPYPKKKKQKVHIPHLCTSLSLSLSENFEWHVVLGNFCRKIFLWAINQTQENKNENCLFVKIILHETYFAAKINDFKLKQTDSKSKGCDGWDWLMTKDKKNKK